MTRYPNTAMREARLARCWTQVQLASTLGIPQSVVSALESGARPTTAWMAQRLAAVFAAAPVGAHRPTKAERNRLDYEEHKAERQSAARKRNRQIRETWKTAIAAWDRLHEWTSPPPDWEATGASQHAVTACCTHPLDRMCDDIFLSETIE